MKGVRTYDIAVVVNEQVRLKPTPDPTKPSFLALVIIDNPRPLDPLLPLPHHHAPRIKPLPGQDLKPPNLLRRPAPSSRLIHIDDPTLDVPALTLVTPPLLALGQLPPICRTLALQKAQIHLLPLALGLHLELAQPLKHAAPALDLAEDAVFVVAEGPVQHPVLVRRADAARGHLGDVDVDGLRGGVVGGCVLLDGQGDGGEGDGFAQEPGEALEGEEGVEGRGEAVVLELGDVGLE
jgi:hypothetical protein